MLVFNLTAQELNYKGRSIPPNGGSQEYPELDKGFIPNRDRALEKKRVLAFGSLPYWWTLEQKVKNEVLTRAKVNARDDQRVKEAERKIKAGAEPVKAVVEALAGKVLDELKVEGVARTILPAVLMVDQVDIAKMTDAVMIETTNVKLEVEQVEQVESKDRGYGGKGRRNK